MEIVVTNNGKQELDVKSSSYILIYEEEGKFIIKGSVSPALLVPLLGSLMTKWGKGQT